MRHCDYNYLGSLDSIFLHYLLLELLRNLKAKKEHGVCLLQNVNVMVCKKRFHVNVYHALSGVDQHTCVGISESEPPVYNRHVRAESHPQIC